MERSVSGPSLATALATCASAFALPPSTAMAAGSIMTECTPRVNLCQRPSDLCVSPPGAPPAWRALPPLRLALGATPLRGRPCRSCALRRARRPCVAGLFTIAPCHQVCLPRRQPFLLCSLPPWRAAAAAGRAARVAGLAPLASPRRHRARRPRPPRSPFFPPVRTAAQPHLAVAHLAVVRPCSSNAVRPQTVREHDETGTPRAVNRRPPAQHTV